MHGVVEALCQRAAERPDHPALIAGGVRLSYGELWERAQATAGCLVDQGVQPRDRVMIAAESDPAFAVGYFAIHLARAIAAPFDPDAPVQHVRELLWRVGPRVVLGGDRACRARPALGSVPLAELEQLPARACPDLPRAFDLADLLFTSGTTGRAKGVVLTHQAILIAARRINAVIGNGADDVEVMPLRLSHSFGLARLRCAVLTGGTLVLLPRNSAPEQIFDAIERHGATGLVHAPDGFAALLRSNLPGLAAYAAQLRYVEIGSAPMPRSDKVRLAQQLPDTALFMHYGLTEASRSAFLEFHRNRDKLDSGGKPCQGVEVSIRNELGDDVCDPELTGQLWLRSATLARGYWDDAALGARTFVAGWVCTGDFARLDADGFLHLAGRREEIAAANHGYCEVR